MMANKPLFLMKEYCTKLNDPDAEEYEVYRVLLPAIICCEISRGDAIECVSADLVQDIITFMITELGITDIDFLNGQCGSIIEDVIEFTVKTILEKRKEVKC